MLKSSNETATVNWNSGTFKIDALNFVMTCWHKETTSAGFNSVSITAITNRSKHGDTRKRCNTNVFWLWIVVQDLGKLSIIFHTFQGLWIPIRVWYNSKWISFSDIINRLSCNRRDFSINFIGESSMPGQMLDFHNKRYWLMCTACK